MKELTLTSADKLTVYITRVDNTVKVSLNGSMLYSEYFDDDLPLKKSVDLTAQLAIGVNNLVIELYNQGINNPWHIAYEIKRGDEVLSSADEKSAGSYDPQGGLKVRNEFSIIVGR